jgi:hypothetical protein
VKNRCRGKLCGHPVLRGRGGIYLGTADAGMEARKGGARCCAKAEGADWGSAARSVGVLDITRVVFACTGGGYEGE